MKRLIIGDFMKSKLTPREIDLIYSDSILLADAMDLDLAPYATF